MAALPAFRVRSTPLGRNVALCESSEVLYQLRLFILIAATVTCLVTVPVLDYSLAQPLNSGFEAPRRERSRRASRWWGCVIDNTPEFGRQVLTQQVVLQRSSSSWLHTAHLSLERRECRALPASARRHAPRARQPELRAVSGVVAHRRRMWPTRIRHARAAPLSGSQTCKTVTHY